MLLLVIFVFWLCDKKKEKFTNKENIICGIKEKDDKNNLYCKKLDFKNKNSLLDYFSSNNSSKNDTNSWNVIEENVNKVYLSTSKDKDGIQRHNLYTLNDIGELRYRDYNEDGSTTQNLSILKSEKNPIFNDLSIGSSRHNVLFNFSDPKLASRSSLISLSLNRFIPCSVYSISASV